MASSRKFLVLAKIEVTQFTDSAPVPGTDAMLVKNLKVTPLKVDNEDRNLIRSYYGNSERLVVSEEAQIDFDVEVAGAGTAGSVPKWDPLMQACGFSATNNPGVSEVYAPISTAQKSVTIWCYRDGWIYKMTGAQGTMQIDAGAKKIPHFKFHFVGKYVAVADLAIGTGTFTGWSTPVASIPANTGTTTLNSVTCKMADLNLDMANDLSHLLWMNGETMAIVDRKPKGSITVEAVTIATYPFYADIRAGTSRALTWAHGVSAGNIVQIDCPKVQLSDIEETDNGGTLAYKMNMVLNPNAGNDELIITAK